MEAMENSAQRTEELQRTDRVTLFPDGTYRWYYDMDMKKNLYMFKYALKLMFIMAIFVDVVLFFMLDRSMVRLWAMIAVIVVVSLILLWCMIYLIWGLICRWSYRVFFDMNEDVVALVYSEKTNRRNEAFAVISAVLGTASGHPVQGMTRSAVLATSKYTGYTGYKSIRKLNEHRDCDLIQIKEFIFGNTIYVGPEDYDFVYEYIRSRSPKISGR